MESGWFACHWGLLVSAFLSVGCDSERLLLGQAMKASEPPDQVKAVDASHGQVRPAVLQNLQSDVICGVTECRHNYPAVHMDEIAVGSRQSEIAFKFR